MPDCIQCGRPLADEAAFCSACGAPVVPTGADTGAPSDAAPGTPPGATPPVGARPLTDIVAITALAVIAVVAVIGIIFVATRHSGSSNATIDPFQAQQTKAKDSAVKEGIHSIQVGIQSWAVDNGDVFPPDADVRSDGAIGQYVDNWPTNPFTGEPMTSSSGPGNFTYTLGLNSTTFQLSGHMSTGDFTVP